MNKKTIIFYAFAGLFFVSGLYGFTQTIGGAIVCIAIAVVFFLLARKSKSPVVNDTVVNNVPTQQPVTDNSPEFIFDKIKVSGVTFKNSNKSRQAILRAIKFRDEPYADGLDLSISYYEYEGAPAYYVNVNDEPIGNIPADKVAYIDELMNAGRIVGVTYISVYGGGRDDSGKSISYGAEITIKIKSN